MTGMVFAEEYVEEDWSDWAPPRSSMGAMLLGASGGEPFGGAVASPPLRGGLAPWRWANAAWAASFALATTALAVAAAISTAACVVDAGACCMWGAFMPPYCCGSDWAGGALCRWSAIRCPHSPWLLTFV